MQDLKKVNFCFPAYEHFLNHGMWYYYRGDECVIGGKSLNGFSEMDRLVAEEGCWLPTDSQLLQWLALVEIDVLIRLDASEQFYYLEARDCLNGATYNSCGRVLAFALAVLIRKICKSNLRPYVPVEFEHLKIDG